MRLYLVRHAQTAWNAEQRAQGHVDTELDETGQGQAEQLVRVAESVTARRVLCSDLRRCVDTVRSLAGEIGAPIETTPLLRERNFGSLEGLPYHEVRAGIARIAEQNGVQTHEAVPPGGESLRDVWLRLAPVAERLSSEPHDTLVVSHGGALGLLIARLIAAGPEASRAFRFANASLTELQRREDGSWSIERLNDSSHLEVVREGFGSGT